MTPQQAINLIKELILQANPDTPQGFKLYYPTGETHFDGLDDSAFHTLTLTCDHSQSYHNDTEDEEKYYEVRDTFDGTTLPNIIQELRETIQMPDSLVLEAYQSDSHIYVTIFIVINH